MKKSPVNAKRLLAWTGIVILVLLYLATLISALIGTTFADQLFHACLYSTIIVPVMCWFFIMTIGWVQKKGYNEESETEEE